MNPEGCIVVNHKLYRLTFRIACTNIEIQSPFRYRRDNLLDFITSSAPDCSISFTEEEITKEQIWDDTDSDASGWEGYFSTDILLQKIADALLGFNSFLIHGAAISHNGNGYLFSAPSGTGKTTHIRLWLQNLPDVVVINGDKPFIHADTDKLPLLCGSPWGGKEGLCSNQIAPLKAIVFLQRAERNAIHQVSFGEIFPQLFQQVYRPADPILMHKSMELIRRVKMSNTTFWRFDCNNFAEDCFQTSYNALTGNKLP